MNKFIKLPLYLAIVGAVSTAALATVYEITAPIIAEAKIKAEKAALIQIFPEAEFSLVEDAALALDTSETSKGLEKIFAAKENGETVGYIYKGAVSGFKGGAITFLISISPDGKFNGYAVTGMTDQTQGIGTKVADKSFYDQFLDKEITVASSILTIDGATFSSEPVVNAIKAAANHFNSNVK